MSVNCQTPLQIGILPARAGDGRDSGFDPWMGKIPWRRHGNPLQCSCLENPHGQEEPDGL